MKPEQQTTCGRPAAFWELQWHRALRANPAIVGQRRHPGRWRRFYEEAGSSIEALRGFPAAAAAKAAAAIQRAAGLEVAGRVVDLGCGRGWLAAALAARGLAVLAVDASPSAVAAVRERARRRGLSRLRARCCSWLELSPRRRADLSLAAFFPNAWTPQGFRRMERLGRRGAVLWGEGIRSFPWTIRLWRRLAEVPPVGARDLGWVAVNWLFATGRPFAFERVALPLRIDCPAEVALGFYRRYFALFDCPADRIEEALAVELRPYLRGGRLSFSGATDVCLLVWGPPPQDRRHAMDRP